MQELIAILNALSGPSLVVIGLLVVVTLVAEIYAQVRETIDDFRR
jgi:hypothetical protein